MAFFIFYNKTKHDDFDPVVPILPDVNILEHEVETEATVQPHLPTSIEQGLPTTIEHELDTHSNESAGVAVEGSSNDVLDNADATGGTIELLSELERENPIPSAQPEETGVDVVSISKDALTAHEVETEVEVDTHVTTPAPTSKNDLAAEELSESEQPVIPTTEVFIFYSFAKSWLTQVLHLRETLPNI